MNINLAELEQHLAELPSKIRNQSLIALEKEKLLKETELEYDVQFGMALVGAKKNNATEKKAEATIISKDVAIKVIEAEYNYKKEEIAVNYLKDRFTSFRKIGSLETELLRTQITGN
jgi:hypothetical protein